jgi:hypothetical protein
MAGLLKGHLIKLLTINDGDIEGLWNLNEDSGNALDLSSNGYNLTAQGYADLYSESNYSADVAPIYGGGASQGYQSFTGKSGKITSCKWYLKKTGLPTGNITAKLYAHSGTYGSSSVPTGVALATSDNVDVSTLSTSIGLINFTFTGANQYTTTGGTYYCIVVEYTGGDAGKYISFGTDNSSPTHGGNTGYFVSPTYTAISGSDACFYIFGEFYSPTSNDGLMDNSEYFTIADASCANLELTGAQTFFAWFKPESFATLGSVVRKGGGATIHGIAVNTDGTIEIRFTGLTTTATFNSDVVVSAGTWYFLCGVVDIVNTKLKLWVNGTKKEATCSGATSDTNGIFCIGADSGGNYYDGLIQNAGVLSVALTDAQVALLYADIASTNYLKQYRRTRVAGSITGV